MVAMYLGKMLDFTLNVNLGRVDAGVAEHFFQVKDVCTLLSHHCSKGVPQLVGVKVYAALSFKLTHDRAKTVVRERLAVLGHPEGTGGRLILLAAPFAKVAGQGAFAGFGKDSIASASFARDGAPALLEVHITQPDRKKLAPSHATVNQE